ncbi:MAG: DUF4129 domain-containing protein [Acidobacteria bacterium]|nr:DUF4129 domain-containing protein [Acidobacteriota bacterium]
MKRALRAGLLVFVLAPVLSIAQQEPAITAEEFAAQLDYWLSEVETLKPGDPAPERPVPPEWRVRWGENQEVVLETGWLADGLTIIRNNPKQSEAFRWQVTARLEALHAEASGLLEEGGVDPAKARGTLADILSRREFSTVRGPTWWDDLRLRINQWIGELLEKLFGRVVPSAFAGEVLLWLVIAVLVSILAVGIKRMLLRPARSFETEPEALPLQRDWSQLTRDAAAAAARGDYRRAILLAYWAAIHRLESLGVWTVERSRTPREYLRLLPARDAKRTALTAITRRFEAVWYGGQPAGANDFQEVIAHGEQLGCLFPWNPATGKS